MIYRWVVKVVKSLSKIDENVVTRWVIPEVGQKSSEVAGGQDMNAETIGQRAYDEGFAKGLQDGNSAAQQRIEKEVKSLRDIIHAMQQPLEILDQSIQQQMVNLCLAICEQILHQALKIEPEFVIQFVQHAMQELPDNSRGCTIYINEADKKLIQQHCALENEKINIDFRLDNSLQPGEFHIATEQSKIDARFHKRLAEIAQGLMSS